MTDPTPAPGGDPLVVSAWGSVAEGYGRYWTPRFRPFVASALEAFVPGPGALWVVGCGPGDEAQALAGRFPDRELFATDPAPGMAALARTRLSCLPNARVQVGSATQPPVNRLGGLFSSFVLQLLPDRAAALSAWRAALAPEGVAAALFWPRQPDDSAWGRMGRAIQEVTGKARPDWEPDLRRRLGSLGLELVRSLDVRHELSHATPEEAWTSLRDACSCQVLLQRIGREGAEACGQRWLRDPGLRERDGEWVHEATARLWLLAPADR